MKELFIIGRAAVARHRRRMRHGLCSYQGLPQIIRSSMRKLTTLQANATCSFGMLLHTGFRAPTRLISAWMITRVFFMQFCRPRIFSAPFLLGNHWADTLLRRIWTCSPIAFLVLFPLTRRHSRKKIIRNGKLPRCATPRVCTLPFPGVCFCAGDPRERRKRSTDGRICAP